MMPVDIVFTRHHSKAQLCLLLGLDIMRFERAKASNSALGLGVESQNFLSYQLGAAQRNETPRPSVSVSDFPQWFFDDESARLRYPDMA
jgi:hypothetical protein